MKISRSGLGLLAAGFLAGSLAVAQTSSPQSTYPAAPASGAGASVQTAPPSGSAQAGVSATTPAGQAGTSATTPAGQAGVSATTPTGQAGVSATTPVGQAGVSATTPQTSTTQTSQPQSSAPQGSTTTYTTTTQTTVPQSSQPAATQQNGAAGSTASPSGQAASSVPGTVPATGQPETLIDPGRIYNDKQPTSWVGKPVVLQNVMIQDTNDSGNFWVGSDGDHRLLVVKQENNATLKAMRFHKGDVVTVTGTVQPASKYMAQQTTESGGDMHDAEKSTGVILLADNITVSSSTHK
jgi:hypothetical protein